MSLAPNGTPKSSPMSRPTLPLQHLNPVLATLDSSKIPQVKFQEIVRDGQSTIVARMKIPTPSGHAFILRRLDTGAISLTTMFRTAFPTAPDDIERREANWVKQAFETSGANKSGKARFAGTWVAPEVAQELAKEYSLSHIIQPLLEANPDPTIVYSKSKKTTQQPTPVASPVAQPQAATTPREAHPAKRRREGSPGATPSKYTRGATPQSVRAPPTTPGRRSARLRSPAVTQTPVSSVPPTKTPKSARAARDQLTTLYGSDETIVDEEANEAAHVAEIKVDEDIRESKELVANIKSEYAARTRTTETSTTETVESETTIVEGPSQAQKRAREEESVVLKLNIKEPETEERALVTNSRIRSLTQTPERKSLAWGALLFAAGLGAVTFLPSLPSFL